MRPAVPFTINIPLDVIWVLKLIEINPHMLHEYLLVTSCKWEIYLGQKACCWFSPLYSAKWFQLVESISEEAGGWSKLKLCWSAGGSSELKLCWLFSEWGASKLWWCVNGQSVTCRRVDGAVCSVPFTAIIILINPLNSALAARMNPLPQT